MLRVGAARTGEGWASKNKAYGHQLAGRLATLDLLADFGNVRSIRICIQKTLVKYNALRSRFSNRPVS